MSETLDEYLEAFGVKTGLLDMRGDPIFCSFCERRKPPQKVRAVKTTHDGIPYCAPCGRWVE